jgi:predicted transposase/invertase (TIGR01784 family)
VQVRNVELPVRDIGDKCEKFDVNCRTDSGEQAELEMQADPMEGDSMVKNRHATIKSRAVYNLCDLHSSQPGRGVRYDKLIRSFQVTFCGYTLFDKRTDFVNRFGFRNEAGDELCGVVGIIFVELTKLGEILKKPVGEMTPLEMWATFFAVAHKPKYSRLLDEMAGKREEIQMASELLSNISSDEIQRAHFRSRRLYERDREHERVVIRDMSKAEGKIEGKAEGKIEGKAERSIEIACNAIAMGLPMEQIQQLTGFTRTEIENLSRQ